MNAAHGHPARRRSLSWLTRRYGRPGGLILTLLLALLLVSVEYAPQAGLRRALFDTYQRVLPRERINDSVVIVGIDERSLAELGHWPWPRTWLRQLVDQVAAQRPAALAIDILFSEPDRMSPRALGASMGRTLTGSDLRPEQLAALPDADEMLAEGLAALPVVLGVGALSNDAGLYSGVPYRPILRQNRDGLVPYLDQYRAALRSLEGIDQAALGHGVYNPVQSDGRVRQVPTLVAIDGIAVPGLALEVLRVLGGDPGLDVELGPAGVRSVGTGGFTIPTDPQGHWWLHFSDWKERPRLAAVDVLRGKIPEGVLEGRVVLLGYTALGLQDTITTALGRMPGVEVHAEAIENVLDERLLRRPHNARSMEAGLFVLLALLAVWVVPALRPAQCLALFLAAATASWGLGLALFSQHGLLLDAANPVVMAGVMFGLMLILGLNESQWQQRRLQSALSASREAEARLQGEFDAAKRIQLGMLPRAEDVLAGETRAEISAFVDSARVVGGDLYDFFRFDDTNLYFLVGDVSGKGLPASLFMALTKALTKGAAQRSLADPGQVLQDASDDLALENPEQMFVTMVAGVLNLDTGDLAWCSAGHDTPYLLPPDHAGLKQLSGVGGPPLCVAEGYAYPTERLQLNPGDLLCLYSDGVTEAQNAAGEFYGQERLRECLRNSPPGCRVGDLATLLREDVQAFVAGAESADDVTVLMLRWSGRQSLSERRSRPAG